MKYLISAPDVPTDIRRQLPQARVVRLLGGVGLAALAYSAAPAYAQSNSPAFQGLGILGGPHVQADGYALGVSADGTVVVGASVDAALHYEAFRWTLDKGLTGLGTLGASGSFINSQANGVSADGAVVVGSSSDSSGHGQAFRWTAAGGMAGLGFLGKGDGGYGSSAAAVSADGTVVVGNSTNATSLTEAFRWTQAGGLVGLGFIAGGSTSVAAGVSADGSAVAGYAIDSLGTAQAFRWTPSGGMAGLGFIAGGGLGPSSTAAGISGDGTVVVGQSTNAANQHEASRWSQSTGTIGLGFIGTGGDSPNSQANGTNLDGSIIVGQSSNAKNVLEASRWTQATGTQSLAVLLTQAGVNLGTWSLSGAYAISANGQFIVGAGIDPAGTGEPFLVRYIGSTAPIGGMTTPSSIVNSINMLGAGRSAIMVQEHGFAAPLLGGNGPITGGGGDDAGIFAAVGSASGGASGRKSLGGGFSVTLGLSVASESYTNATMNDAVLIAASVRYVHDLSQTLHPFVEAGGWYAPSGTYQFSRAYANGAGLASGTGSASGEQSYVFGRAGLALNLTPSDELAFSAEIGRQTLDTAAYAETLSAGNPFNALVSSGQDRMTVGKIRGQWTHAFSPALDATITVAGARAFDYSSSLVATVAGVGTLSPALRNPSWIEDSARVSYRLSNLIRIEGFVNSVSGLDGGDTRVHVGGGVKVSF